MAVEVMTRRAVDNAYLHRDFHTLLNLGLDYVYQRHGANGVREYLTDYARSFFRPLIEEVRAEGLLPIKKHFIKIYTIEEVGDFLTVEMTESEMRIKVERCPALDAIRRSGEEPSFLYSMTDSVVWSTVAQEAGIHYSLLSYDLKSGRAEHIFYKESQTVKGTPE